MIKNECIYKKQNPEVSKRAINQQLYELIKNGIIQKKNLEVYPRKVEYSLTKLGKELIPVINAL